LALAAYFTRDYWLPTPLPTPTPFPTATRVPPTATSLPPTATRPAPTPTRVSNLGTGDVQVTLIWSSYNDLDLYVTDPAGETIYYNHPEAASGGKLDVDANRGCFSYITSSPVENIFWATGSAPRGSYTVRVNYYQHCSTAPLADSYIVRLLVDGNVQEFSGTVSTVGEDDLITTFSR